MTLLARSWATAPSVDLIGLDAALNLLEDVEALNDLLLGPLLQEQHMCTRKI